MISITLTGNTIDEVGGQALALVMKLAGAQNAPVVQSSTMAGLAEHPLPVEPTQDLVDEAEERSAASWEAMQKAGAEAEAARAALNKEQIAKTRAENAALPRKRRTRAEIDAANAAAQKASTIGAIKEEVIEALVADMAAIEAEPTPVEIVEALAAPMFDDLKRALQEVCETNGAGVDAAKLLMADFATPPRLSLIKEERWPEFIERARAVVAGARK